jgi:ubiquinone/menaquinone biosynthesis C-methylase UbiE
VGHRKANERRAPAGDPRGRFTGAAEGYARYRPGYPGPLVDWVLEEAGVGAGDPAADVGCGTGILTRMLAERGLPVVGVDPNEDMLARARAAGGTAEYRRGDAEATGLPDRSTALVTAAQAFHWFDLDAALGELGRILRPEGHGAALWNIRGRGPFMTAYDAVLRRFSSEYEVLESWETTLETLKRHPRVHTPRERWKLHAQQFDLEGLRGRAWSSSYVYRGVQDREGFDVALRTLFEKHARGGTVEFPYRTVALVFSIAPGESRTGG